MRGSPHTDGLRETPAETLHAVEQGRGRAIVLLPGLGGTTRYWECGLAPLAAAARVIRLDPLGFGESPKPWCAYTLERHVAAVDAATAHVSSMTLVGHSLGAALALTLAARRPDRVDRLVLMGLPYFGSRGAAYRYYRRGPSSAWWATNVAILAAGCIVTRRVLGSILPYVLTDVPRVVAQDLVKHTWRSSTSSLWNVLYDHDLATEAAALPPRMAVTCIHGDRDSMAPLEGVHRLAHGRKAWAVVTLAGIDHHPWLRDAETCRRIILAEE